MAMGSFTFFFAALYRCFFQAPSFLHTHPFFFMRCVSKAQTRALPFLLQHLLLGSDTVRPFHQPGGTQQRAILPVNRVVLGLPQVPAELPPLHSGVETHGDEEKKAWCQLQCSHHQLCVREQVRPLSGVLHFFLRTMNISDYTVAKHLGSSKSP